LAVNLPAKITRNAFTLDLELHRLTAREKIKAPA